MDLYYRLHVVAIPGPPLRERPEDLVPLVAFLLDKHARLLRRPRRTVSPEAMDLLRAHPWPGNVRELENALERALVLGAGDEIEVGDLPESMRPPFRPPSAATKANAVRSLADLERDEITAALREARGNKARAARLLGIERKTLYRKIQRYRIGASPAAPRQQR